MSEVGRGCSCDWINIFIGLLDGGSGATLELLDVSHKDRGDRRI